MRLSLNSPIASRSIALNKEYSSRSVAVTYDQSDSLITFAASEMKKAFESAGHTVSLGNLGCLMNITAQNRIVITTRDTKEAKHFLSKKDVARLPSSEPQGYSIRKKTHTRYTEWYVIGFDNRGALIGGIDFGKLVELYGFISIGDTDKKPYIKKRGIKFNIPLDARTPSYSDSGDSAQKNIANMWDMVYWGEFLDEMARNHFNVLSLWSLHPFPSLVKVPLYPKASLCDVKKTTAPLSADLEGRDMSTSKSLESLETLKDMTMDQKVEHWQHVMQYAEDRGIDIYIFTWNTFIYGTESSGYSFTTSITDTKTQHYFRKSVEALINTYPLLKGIGVTTGENMSRDSDMDEAWLYNTYGEGINDALALDESRTFSLIHRIQYANISKALNAFLGLNSRCSVDTSFKYSQAHLYSSTKPDYIHKNNDTYLNDIGNHKTWLTVRDDDYYMLRGGSDPEFVRNYIKNMPYEKLQGFHLGADGYTWGREYISKASESPNQLVIKKRWYSFMIWGRLAYNPDISEEYFVRALGARFSNVNSQNLYQAWSKASQIIPLVNRLHNEKCQLDFQWYPEACTSRLGFHDINRFIECAAQSGEGIMSIPAYAEAVLKNTAMTGTTPVEIANNIFVLASNTLELTEFMSAGDHKELSQTIEDINAMAILGQYYSRKILGATNKCLADHTYDLEKKVQYKSCAVGNLKEASDLWRVYAAKINRLYIPQVLTRLIPEDSSKSRYIDITKLQADVDNDIELV